MTHQRRTDPMDLPNVTLVIGVAIDEAESDRARNLEACLCALRHQTLAREHYRVVLVEQGVEPRLDGRYRDVVDNYCFAYSRRPFNRGWVLNIGGLQATNGVICTFDADLIVPPDFLRRGLLAWQCGAAALKPFTDVLYMDRESTERVRLGVTSGSTIDCGSVTHGGEVHFASKGGCIWIDAALYRRMRGHDERFEGWGLEDREFWYRLEKHTPIVTLSGTLLHMHHERSIEQRPEVHESAVLYRALQSGLLPPQRDPVGDPNKFRPRAAPCDDAVAAPTQQKQQRAALDPTTVGGPHDDELPRLADLILAEAEWVCTEARGSRGAYHDPDRLHLRGLLAARHGRDGLALACLAAAVRREPTHVGYRMNLSLALVRLNRFDEAVEAGLQALRLAPHSPAPYRVLGHALRKAGRSGEGIALLQEALLLDLSNAAIVSELAEAFHANTQFEAAERACELASRMDPENAVFHQRLGESRLCNGKARAALEAFRRAGELITAQHRVDDSSVPSAPDSPAATPPWQVPAVDGRAEREWRCTLQRGVGDALFRLGRIDEAVQSFRGALNYAPTSVETCRQLAIALDSLGRHDDALAARNSLGVALASSGRTQEAAAAFENALAHNGNSLKALLALGDLHADAGRLRQALTCFERAQVVDPEHVRSRVAVGRTAYALGDIDRAWRAFAAYDTPAARDSDGLEQPRWNGGSLKGQTILVRAGEALGDTIQGLRYLPFLRTAGARVIFQCQARLAPLARRLPSIDIVIAEHAPLPAFDVCVPILQIPVMYPACRWPIPPPPRLRSDDRLDNIWKERLRSRLTAGIHENVAVEIAVGLCWSGHPDGINARARFTQLASFAPLANVQGVRYVSLQMGPQTSELLWPPPGLTVTHLQDDSCSMDDTAALMQNLDVIVTVDTAVAHLAGALDRPAWMLLPYVADWRWMNETERTPLYPTMTIFRQTSMGDWAGVFARVRSALVQEVERVRWAAKAGDVS